MSKKRFSWYSVVLHVLLVGLSIEVLYLVKQNRDLRQRIEESQPERIAEGDRLEPVPAVDLQGRPARLEFADARDTLLYVFTTTCPICTETQPTWKTLYEELGDRYDVVGVTVSDPEAVRQYAREHDLSYPILIPQDRKGFPKAYKIPGVPTTVRVAPDGTVRQVWVGRLEEGVLGELAEG